MNAVAQQKRNLLRRWRRIWNGGDQILPNWMKGNRRADIIIGGEEHPYLFRWFLLPRNRLLNIYLHKIVRSDDDRALHDHPWDSVSVILWGGYLEILPVKAPYLKRGETAAHVTHTAHWRQPLSVIPRRAECCHRLVIDEPHPAWTLFITGPKRRSWGFHCQRGWIHWRDFTAGDRGEIVGRGCE